jgi:hypothetical protein
MSGDDRPNPPTWGRRPYADAQARSILNDESERIARDPPDHVDNPSNPTLSDVLRERFRDGTDVDPGLLTLADLKGHGLTFEEIVCWYFYRFAGYDIAEIHRAVRGTGLGSDPSHRRNSIRNIQRILKSAATKLPSEDSDGVPDMVDVDLEAHTEA